MAAASTSSEPKMEKPVVVRMKRKASQARIDAIWLEVNDRPLKRSLLDFERLSISGHGSEEKAMPKRLLLQRIETLSSSEQTQDVLQSILPNCTDSKHLVGKIKERSGYFKQEPKRDQLRSVARQEHKDHVRGARFQQIWERRRGDAGSMRKLCDLYEVVRTDEEVEKPTRKKEFEPISAEDSAILCNYLPLLREYVSSAAEEIEHEMMAYLSTEDTYVYDLYTVGEDFTGIGEDVSHGYPLLQVEAENSFDDMSESESEYDSEDSNAENNPKNDYPDEDEEYFDDEDDDDDDDEEEDADSFGDSECPNSDFEYEFAGNKKLEKESEQYDDMQISGDSEHAGSDYQDDKIGGASGSSDEEDD